MITQYKLLKDLPDVKAGSIIKKRTDGLYYTDNLIRFSASTVENNPDWFAPYLFTLDCGTNLFVGDAFYVVVDNRLYTWNGDIRFLANGTTIKKEDRHYFSTEKLAEDYIRKQYESIGWVEGVKFKHKEKTYTFKYLFSNSFWDYTSVLVAYEKDDEKLYGFYLQDCELINQTMKKTEDLYQDSFGDVIDLNNPETYKDYPSTIEGVDKEIMATIGYYYYYVKFKYPDIFKKEEQKKRVKKLIQNYTDNRKENEDNLLWFQKQLFLLLDETENMC